MKNVDILLALEQLKQIFAQSKTQVGNKNGARASVREKNYIVFNDSTDLWPMLTPRSHDDWKYVSILCLDVVTKQIGHNQKNENTKKKNQLKQPTETRKQRSTETNSWVLLRQRMSVIARALMNYDNCKFELLFSKC